MNKNNLKEFSKSVLIPFLSIPVLALLVFYFLSFLGFRIDSATFYGISAERRPEIGYVYDDKIDGFRIDWKPDVQIEQINWYLQIGVRKYEVKSFPDVDPFLISKRGLIRVLFNYSIDKVIQNKTFSSNGIYSEKELKDGIECVVLPYFNEQGGIIMVSKMRYLNNGSNEIHETIDKVELRGFGGSSPKASVTRNISKEDWNNIFNEEGKKNEEILKLITEKRAKYKNEEGECLERFSIEYELKQD